MQVDYESPAGTISRLQHLAAIIEKTGSVDYLGVEKQFSVRLPLSTATLVDALAEVGEVSRNTVAVELIDLALDELAGSLSKETQAKVQKVRSRLLREAMQAEKEAA